MHSSALFHQFFRGFLIDCEIAAITSVESQDPMRLVLADHEVGHVLVIIEIGVAERTFELDKHAGIQQLQD